MTRTGTSGALAALTLATLAAADCGCATDLNGDDVIDVQDLTTLILAWGDCGDVGGGCPPADLNGDGEVDVLDLTQVILAWGPCAEPGGFPIMWINGGPSCVSEPDIQVHQYNDDLYILRQSLCTNFEGPFIYLIFGEDQVLMQDTGAGGIAIADAVYAIIDEWLVRNGRTSIELVVSHSHAHGDHVQGDGQFLGQPDTTVVGLSQASVASFFGITSWPEQIVEMDLGGRIVDVIAIPGHHSSHVALYDRRTAILFTGDTLYPGRLYISSFAQYVESIGRLVDFVADKPVCHVLGTHIEMTNTPGVDFNFGSTHHPDEHPLQLGREHLLELLDAVVAMQAAPFIEVHDDFIVWPLGGR